MQAVAQALSGHDLLAQGPRGRLRSSSEAFPPVEHELVDTPSPIPKAASYTYFPKVPDLLDPTLVELKGTISEEELRLSVQDGGSSCTSSGGSSPSSEEAPQPEQLPHLKTSNSRRSSRFLPFAPKSREHSAEPKSDRSRHGAVKQADSPSSVSPVRSLSMLRRKSWMSSQSRSSSPTKDTSNSPVTVSEAGRKPASVESGSLKSLTGALSIPENSKAKEGSPDPPKQQPRTLTKKTKRPLSGFFSSSTTEPESPRKSQPKPAASDAPAVPALPKSFSTERLPSFTHSPTTTSHIPPIPRNTSSDKLKGVRTEPRKKDELWTVFRTLEADLRKFQSKSIAFKANVVRTTLLPFLRSYGTHPSTYALRLEDLDRRANILNGWWTGLLELLAGRNNQSISGTDRPAILDGIAGIMERPEWRMAPSPFAALADRVETSSTATAKSAVSNSSTSSDFLAESVYHNVRNIFTQNLLSQMSFVVDKMSLRNAAASLVTFCGKTCAYAFCFCPGVADILVRLWKPSMDLMKRVMEESGVSRQTRLDVLSDRVAHAFPPTLQSLKFESLAKTVRTLRQPPSLPFGAANLDWYGAWVKRWSGAESDLFYVFVKHYHILIGEFLPIEPSNTEQICVPGLIMVHAQILANLEATLNRHASPQQAEEQLSGAASITFDDVLGDPDASASNIPIPPANVTRQMAENRLIMLIRDFLSERNTHLSTARHMFAKGFARLLKGATKKVSIYDSNACYTLCDFLEEAFAILVRYDQLDPQRHSVLDWPFWLSVFKHMTASQNTATEIKLFAFLFSTWPTLCMDEQRKTSLCLELLLDRAYFASSFNHWCPMVRAYFMRLLCWRVARFDGEQSESEINIMSALSDRLRETWAQYLWLREEAERKSMPPPSTAACNPAPGRRFLIIRNDNPMAASNGPFLSFDGVVQSPNALKRLSSGTSTSEADGRPMSSHSAESADFPDEEASKGRWGLLRNLIGVSKPRTKSSSPGPARKDSGTKAANPSSSGTPKQEPPSGTAAVTEVKPTQPTHRSFSFRFSLEWVDKRFGTFQNMRLSPPRLPLPAQMLLQSRGINVEPISSSMPSGAFITSSRYAGRALAEWTFISHECQNFFERRKNEGVPTNRFVETPSLAVEAFRRPG